MAILMAIVMASVMARVSEGGGQVRAGECESERTCECQGECKCECEGDGEVLDRWEQDLPVPAQAAMH